MSEMPIVDLTATEPRKWLYGLTADEWLHLAAEGQDSEVGPCCGNISELRENLNSLATFQGEDNVGWQIVVGKYILNLVGNDGAGHNLDSAESFPLLHRVLAGISAQQEGHHAV